MSVHLEGPSFAMWAAQRAQGFGGNLTVVDKVPPEMLHMVDAYWYQYAPLNPLWHGILGFMIGVLGFISVIGNGMVSATVQRSAEPCSLVLLRRILVRSVGLGGNLVFSSAGGVHFH